MRYAESGSAGHWDRTRDDYAKLTLEYDDYRIYVGVKLKNWSMGHR
jgi:hypothetical protein